MECNTMSLIRFTIKPKPDSLSLKLETETKSDGANLIVYPSLFLNIRMMKMNGKEQFLNADESLEKFLATTEKYISSEGIVDKKVNPEVELVLSLKADQISNLTAEQCAEVAYLLYAYCSHIQKVYNKNLAKRKERNNKNIYIYI